MNYESLFMKNTPIPEENLIVGAWYTLITGSHICFKDIYKHSNGTVYYKAFSYINLSGYHKCVSQTVSCPISLTDPKILAKYGLSQPDIKFHNKIVETVTNSVCFENKLKESFI